MTQPNEYDPPDSFAPLSITAGKTQGDWEVEMRSGLAAHFSPLEVAAQWLLGTVQGIIDTIIEALTGLPVVGGVLGDVFDALDGLWNTAQSALDGVGQLAWNLLNDPVGTIGQIPQMLVEGLEDTLGFILGSLENVPIIGDVIRIISGLGSRLFGFIPLANIADEPQTLLWNPGFTGAVSLEPGSGWSWDSTVYRTGGDSEPGAAKAVADGTIKVLRSNSASVAAGKKLPVEVHVLADGLTGSGDLLQLGLIFFDGDTQVDSIIVDSVGVPSDPYSWAAGVSGARMATLAGEVTIPSGVDRVQMRLIVTANATAGTVWWDDADMKLSGLLQQSWVDGLPQALQDIIGFAQSIVDTVVQAITGIPVVGDFLGELFNAVDSLFNDAQDALGGLADLAWDLLNDPISVLGTIPQTLVSGLQSALSGLSNQVGGLINDLLNAPATIIGGFGNLATEINQVLEILAGGIVTPINSLVQAVKDWFNQWFGGGSSTAIPLSQKGAANGVAPLGPTQKIPIGYLPDGLTPTEVSHPHFMLTLDADKPIPNATETVLSGWQVAGSTAPLFEDGTNARWYFEEAGWWAVDTAVGWGSASSGSYQSALTRRLLSDSSLLVEHSDGSPAFSGLWTQKTSTSGAVDVSTSGGMSSGDHFDVRVWQNTGSTLDVLADETFVRAVYVGERMPDSSFIEPVMYDNRGDGATAANSSSTSISWGHQAAGVDRAVIAYVTWTGSIGAPTVTYGAQAMTQIVLATNGTGINQGSMAAYILLDPPTTPQTVTVNRPSGSTNLFRGNTVSYTGVGGYTAYAHANGEGVWPITVPSAPDRRVANAIASTWTGAGTPGQGVIDGYQRTVRFSFRPGQRGGMYGGDAPGAATVTHRVDTTGGRWVSCTIDLHTL